MFKFYYVKVTTKLNKPNDSFQQTHFSKRLPSSLSCFLVTIFLILVFIFFDKSNIVNE